MLKIKFCGKSNSNFKKGKIYTLLKFDESVLGMKTYIVNENHNISYVFYTSLNAFNNDWKVVL